VTRHYLRLINEGLPSPDLIIIDGGKGQLNIVKNKLAELGVRSSVISIAKQKEEIFIPHRRAPIRLRSNSPALHLIQRIRDEAHRFALAYHRKLRNKRMLQV
ncbi:MAG: excinuclease ABC subunit C, partial [Candidatus Omnitrophota bacterium]|jgi:excinuclease ABC subunit C